MTIYRVSYEVLHEVYFEAENEDEAREKFMEADFKTLHEETLATNIMEIEKDIAQ